jgi:hypothetical protein
MTVVSLVVWAAQQTPEDEDVVAGWTAFAVFGLLIVAVVFLGFSLTKQLKKVDRAEEAGLYDPSTKKKRAGRISQAGEADQADEAGDE